MNNARAWHTASVLQNGKVLVAGGYTGFYYLNSTELYDPSLGTWTATVNMITARARHTASVLMNGNVLVTGGYSVSGLANTTELYDLTTGNWTTTGSIPCKKFLSLNAS